MAPDAASADAAIGVARELGILHPRVTRLPGGACNRSWRVTGDGQDIVVRLAGKADLGADRASELAVMRPAAAAGLAPAIRLARPLRGLLVTDFAPGSSPDSAMASGQPMIEKVGRWLARLHALPVTPDMARVDFAARAEAGLVELAGRPGETEAAALLELLGPRRRALGAAAGHVPCHNDLHHLNLIETGGGLLAIDWEYAGAGEPLADLAAYACYHGLDGGAAMLLLHAHAPSAPGQGLERLELLRWVFDCLCYTWFAQARQRGIAVDDSMQVTLLARLLSW